MVKTLQNCDNDEFELIVEACKMLCNEQRDKKRGRKPYPKAFLYAIIYLAVKRDWSLRKAEKWSKENLALLKSLGWEYRNPPKKSKLHDTMKEINTSNLQKIKYLKEKLSRSVNRGGEKKWKRKKELEIGTKSV